MKPTVANVAHWMQTWAPTPLAMTWDRVGLQIGSASTTVNRVMTCLTVSHGVVDQAIEAGATLIVAHHPLIFQPLTAIDPESRVGSLIIRLIRNDVALYVAHTNLDAAHAGVNDVLAERLQLQHVRPLSPVALDGSPLGSGEKETVGGGARTDGAPRHGIGRIGRLTQPISGKDLSRFVGERLDITDMRTVGDDGLMIETVAVVGGSGGSYIYEAKMQGADALITGDVDFHDADEGLYLGLFIVDAGHFGTEKHVPAMMASHLQAKAEKANLPISVHVAEESDPFVSTTLS